MPDSRHFRYPYIVSMNGDDSLPEVDAVSAYATGGGTKQGGGYQQYIANAEFTRWSGWASAGKKVIPTVPTITKQKVASGRYALHFSIFYETIVGESISVVGSLEELGLWFDYECQLKWTEGHIWKSTEPVIVNKSYFE